MGCESGGKSLVCNRENNVIQHRRKFEQLTYQQRPGGHLGSFYGEIWCDGAPGWGNFPQGDTNFSLLSGSILAGAGGLALALSQSQHGRRVMARVWLFQVESGVSKGSGGKAGAAWL